jgi:hypothetical protein
MLHNDLEINMEAYKRDKIWACRLALCALVIILLIIFLV